MNAFFDPDKLDRCRLPPELAAKFKAEAKLVIYVHPDGRFLIDKPKAQSADDAAAAITSFLTKKLTDRPPEPGVRESYDQFVESMVPFCHCADRHRPCDGVLAGGLCDNLQDDPNDDDLTDSDSPPPDAPPPSSPVTSPPSSCAPQTDAPAPGSSPTASVSAPLIPSALGKPGPASPDSR